MVRAADWSHILSLLSDDHLYTLREIKAILEENGHKVDTQAIYRWIRRRNIPKRGTVTTSDSIQNQVCWLGADLKSALKA